MVIRETKGEAKWPQNNICGSIIVDQTSYRMPKLIELFIGAKCLGYSMVVYRCFSECCGIHNLAHSRLYGNKAPQIYTFAELRSLHSFGYKQLLPKLSKKLDGDLH